MPVNGFPGILGQCPEDYENIGGRCLLFLPEVFSNFSEARSACQSYDGDLAIVDDCGLLGEISSYIYGNGEFVSKVNLNLLVTGIANNSLEISRSTYIIYHT